MLQAFCIRISFLSLLNHVPRALSLWDSKQLPVVIGFIANGTYATDEAQSAKAAGPTSNQPDKPQPTPRPSSLPKGFSDSARLVGSGRKQSLVVFQEGVVTVNCTFGNTIMSLTDLQGRVKAWSSGGTAGFKNSNKSKPLATEKAAEQLAAKALKLGYMNVLVKVKGMGNNKQYAVSALSKTGLRISEIQEVTPVPYNGCRLPRKRRT